jgi:uncharacterized protein YfeS
VKFYVMAKSYDTYGSHSSLYRIGDFLLQGAPHFGDALRELTIRLYFPDSGPPKPTLESMFEFHNRYRSTLPKVVYRRAKAQVEIQVASELMDGRAWKPSPRVSLPLFQLGVDEVLRALPLLRKRLKKSDAFDLQGFLSHCEAAKQRIPPDEETLQVLSVGLDAASKALQAGLSPWEKLDIDWAEFHPQARHILDDPFFWDCGNDFSPHGNDTGADLLDSYRRSLKRHDCAHPMQFLERLAKEWGYTGFDSIEEDVRHEAAIGLAFAHMKLRGECDLPTRELAMRSIEWQRKQAQDMIEWPHRGERLKALEVIERKLR